MSSNRLSRPERVGVPFFGRTRSLRSSFGGSGCPPIISWGYGRKGGEDRVYRRNYISTPRFLFVVCWTPHHRIRQRHTILSDSADTYRFPVISHDKMIRKRQEKHRSEILAHEIMIRQRSAFSQSRSTRWWVLHVHVASLASEAPLIKRRQHESCLMCYDM